MKYKLLDLKSAPALMIELSTSAKTQKEDTGFYKAIEGIDELDVSIIKDSALLLERAISIAEESPTITSINLSGSKFDEVNIGRSLLKFPHLKQLDLSQAKCDHKLLVGILSRSMQQFTVDLADTVRSKQDCRDFLEYTRKYKKELLLAKFQGKSVALKSPFNEHFGFNNYSTERDLVSDYDSIPQLPLRDTQEQAQIVEIIGGYIDVCDMTPSFHFSF